MILVVGAGGDTGAGAAPIIAEIARDIGALTVAVAQRAYPDYFVKLAKNVYSLIISDGKCLEASKIKRPRIVIECGCVRCPAML